MAKIDLDIPSLGSKFVDLRDSLPGDAYNWSWERDLSGVNYLAIHHTGGSNTQTPREIADYHINTNGWGGIGYHFMIAKDGTVYYVGDISTARANVANLNEQVIGICLIGSNQFTDGQVDSAHKLCEFLINYLNLQWNAVLGHKELPDQQTDCPGESWDDYKNKILYTNFFGSIVFNDPQNEIKNLQIGLATVNSRLISCQEALQQAQLKGNYVEKPKIALPLPYLLIAASAILALIVNLNLLGLFLSIQPDALFIDIIFSSCLGALVYIYLKKLTNLE